MRTTGQSVPKVTHVGRRGRAVLAAVFLLVAGSSCTGERQPGEDATSRTALTKKVLVIGIDGVRPDVLAAVATPNIDALAASGSYTGRARIGLPSVSGPGWSSLLTGVWPDKHGVTDNDFTGKRYDAYPDFLTRLEQIEPDLNTFAVADWAPLVQADDGAPTISSAVDVTHVLDGYEMGWAEADSLSVALATAHLRTGDPDALFVYLGNPDETSHHFESIGQEYRTSIELADRHVGQLVQAMRSRTTYDQEDWLVLVSTDHGRSDNGGHGDDSPEERTIFYLASGPSATVGTPPDTVYVVDVAVTALAHMGVAADPAWALDGKVVGLSRPPR